MLEIHDVIQWAKRSFPEALFVSTTGFITRDLLEVQDDAENLYLVGSMGMAAPIGLGLALATGQQVVVLDGDGSLMMNLGALPVVGQSDARIVHVVLDNGAHASTGGQKTVHLADPVGVAVACGYRFAVSVESDAELAAVPTRRDGPTLVHTRCAARSARIGARLALTPKQLVTRFQSRVIEAPS
jgi:sulfopyruvate decarboxylase subunit beta